MTLRETYARLGKVERLQASYYGDCRNDSHNPCGLTSSGEVFHANDPDNAASAIHPDGTVLLLRNPATDLAAVVRVNNFGPFSGSRRLDVSRGTAIKLGFIQRGVARLEVMVVYVPTPAETRFKRKRKYAPVAGFLGHASSIEHALLAHEAAAQRSAPPGLPDALASRIAMAPQKAPPAPARHARGHDGQPQDLPRRPSAPPRERLAVLAALDTETHLARTALVLPRRPRGATIARLSLPVPLPRLKPARTANAGPSRLPSARAITARAEGMHRPLALATTSAVHRPPLPRRPTHLPHGRIALFRPALPAR